MNSPTCVRELKVHGLFGLVDRTIPFSDSGLTIVHGPNGSGKTIMLRILHSLLSGHLVELSGLPFESAQITFGDDRSLLVKREDSSGQRSSTRDPIGLELHLLDPRGRRLESHKWRTAESKAGRRRHPRGDAPVITTQQVRELKDWFDDEAADELERIELIRRIDDTFPPELASFFSAGGEDDLPAWFRDVQGQYSRTRFIGAQRLFQHAEPRRDSRFRYRRHSEASINVKAKRLALTLKDRLSELSQRSADLDRTFPERVFRRWQESDSHFGSGQEGDTRDLGRQLALMQESRQRLVQAGMAPPGEFIDIADVPGSEMAQRMLAVYLDDMEKKTEVVKRFADRVNLFLELVNRRLTYKQLELSSDVGFRVSTASGSMITPDKLSSGEQHQVVITFELLFEVPDDALVLIDEPELSLHVQWQIQFLDEVERIREVVPFHLLVATHSPQIVNDRWDSTVSLVDDNNVEVEG